LSIHATSDAVRIENASNITLRNVSLVAGTVIENGFDSSKTSDDFYLVYAKNVTGLEVTNVSFLAGKRQALHLEGVKDAQLRHLDNSGEPENSSEVATQNYFDVVNCDTLLLEDSNLVFQSRFGVFLKNSVEVELRSVTFEGLYINETEPARPVLSVDNDCQNVTISESRCKLSSKYLTATRDQYLTSTYRSTEAVVTLGGTDVHFEDCTVEVDVDSEGVIWGGLWVLSGASQMTLRNNRILRGYGHGITLGSVQWVSSGSSQARSPRPGPGAGGMTLPATLNATHNYVTGNLGSLSLPGQTASYYPSYDEGKIQDLLIADNHIEAMGTNGISILTFWTHESPAYVLLLENLTLERNTITRNLQQLVTLLENDSSITMLSASVADKRTSLYLQKLPFGGVVLGVVGGVTLLRGNSMIGNRPVSSAETDRQRTFPINGIFLWVGDDVTVCDNRIVENGYRLPSGATPTAGVRAGIAVLAAGVRNVTVREDVNRLTQNNGETTLFALENSALRVFGNTVRQPEGRALQGLGYGTAAVFGNFFSSDGNRGAAIATETSLVGDVVFVENLAVPWEQGGTIPSEHQPYPRGFKNPRVITPGTDVAASITSLPSTFRANGRGGHLLFSSNQVAYAWDVTHPSGGSVPIAYYPVALYSLDHVGVHGNQLVCRTGTWSGYLDLLGRYAFSSPVPIDLPLVAQLFAGGHTVNVSLNRFAETLGSTMFSGVAYGQYLGIVANNQGSHAFGCYGPELVNGGSPLVEAGESPRFNSFCNQVLYGATTIPAPRGLRVFFERQFRILENANDVYPPT
jgi:hypothetical protein